MAGRCYGAMGKGCLQVIPFFVCLGFDVSGFVSMVMSKVLDGFSFKFVFVIGILACVVVGIVSCFGNSGGIPA